MGPPTREIVGIGAPPPVDRPGVGGPGPQRSGSGAGVYLVIGLLLIAFVGGVAFFVTSGDDDESGGGGQAAGTGDGPSTGGDDPGDTDPGGIDPNLTTTTAATTPTTLPPTPAQAAVNDCVQVTSAGDFVGTGSCTDGGTPYMVTEVLPAGGSCSNGNASWISSGDFLLCMQINLNETYCYVFPPEGSSDWITPASACQAAGTIHVIDVVPDATSDSACTTSYQWNYWYNIPYPQQVVCVMQY